MRVDKLYCLSRVDTPLQALGRRDLGLMRLYVLPDVTGRYVLKDESTILRVVYHFDLALVGGGKSLVYFILAMKVLAHLIS